MRLSIGTKKGEEGYFDGVIAIDNGDGTYRVDFDDGDVEERAPRCDIRVVPQAETEAEAGGDGSNLQQDEVHALLLDSRTHKIPHDVRDAYT